MSGVGPIENAMSQNANRTPQQILSDLKTGAADKRMTEAEAAAGRGEVAMVANMNVSKRAADLERIAKMPRQTFETEAWYKSMRPGKEGKEKDGDLER